MTVETPWTHGQWYVTPVARTTHRAADGVLIAVSMQRLSKESIVTHHVWHPGRLLGVRVKAGKGSAEADAHFAFGFGPTEVSPATVRENFWANVDRMLRSLPKRTRTIMAIDTNATMTGTKETCPWIGRAGSAAKVERQGWNENGRALYGLLRDHHLAVNTHGAAQKPTWTHTLDRRRTTGASSRTSRERRARKRGPTLRPSCFERPPRPQTSASHDSGDGSHHQDHANSTTTPMEHRRPTGRTEGRTLRRSTMAVGIGSKEVP